MFSNKLTSLPPEIGQLTSLEYLDLSDNELRTLPAELGLLSNLKFLSFWRSQLDTFPEQILKLRKLEQLDYSNKLPTQLPEGISSLSNLRILAVDMVKGIPAAIGGLKSLVYLEIINSSLTTIPQEIGDLYKLQTLSISHTPQLEGLPDSIGRLINLSFLRLSDCKITTLPLSIGRLQNLTQLYLNDNSLVELPSSMGYLLNLKSLHLEGNPLPIPPEISSRNDEPQVIINYYLQHLGGQKKALNEAKVLVVGQSAVGKTSLVKGLVKEQFDKHENKTEGINIEPWHLEVGGEQVKLNVWDFGGQEIMHATHQFFLTKRSLYLLVIDARQDEDENRLEYWLKIIQSFGGDSPVVVVGNKIDQQPLDLDRRGLMAKYRNIRGFVETSCLDGRGLQELKAMITDEVGRLEHIHDQLLTTWFTVKTRLEEMEQDYIPYSEYVRLCGDEQVEDDLSQRTLIGFLHDLGVVLNFQDDPRFEDTNVLNPEWVTGGVYRILNSFELFQTKGVLDRPMLEQILDPRRYPKDKHLFIMDMMRKFELCFDFEGARDERFLIPDLLSKEEPFTGEWDGSLVFQYHYNVLPSSIISRFIVRTHPLIHQNTLWRTGVVLAYDKNRALVKADLEDRKVFIRVGGQEHARRALLAIIRSNFDSIHKTIPGLVAEEKVPLPERTSVVVDYKHLLTLEELGESSFIPEGMSERVEVRRLLDGIELENARREQRRLQRMEEPATSRPAPAQPARAAADDKAFAALCKVKESLDANSRRYGKRILMLCFCAWCVAWLALAGFIYWLGWNVMEPWTYLIGSGVPVLTYLYFATTQQEFNPKEIYERLVERRRRQLYRSNGFDAEAYDRLAQPSD
ncbi:MAG: GTP-binding protein [Acidobacteria bacterium]|nr:GTP-binding protein [Acidobacteriota bacterium]